MAGGGGNKKRFQNCTDPSGQEILYLRALQGHSGRNLIDPPLQDSVFFPDGFFQYICHIGCAINLHSITNSGSIPGGQILSKRQTVFFTYVDPMYKEHKNPNNIDLEAPRLAWYKQKKWKIHQDTEYWVDINLLKRKGFHSIFTLQATGCDFQHGPNLGVPSNPTFRSDNFSPLGKKYSRRATDSVNCENSSVSFVMKYCPTPTVVRNPASVQILITRFYCESLSNRSWYFCNRSPCAGSSVEGVRCFHQQTCWHKQWVRLSCQYRSPRSYMAGFVFLTQI